MIKVIVYSKFLVLLLNCLYSTHRHALTSLLNKEPFVCDGIMDAGINLEER